MNLTNPLTRSLGRARIVGALAASSLAIASLQGCPSDDCERNLTCERSSTSSGGQGGAGGDGGSGGEGVGGAGLLMDGAACSTPAVCMSGHCSDGVCCAEACDGVCQSCNLAGAEGVCTADAATTDPGGDCGLASCDGAGACDYAKHTWSQAVLGSVIDNIRDMDVDSAGNIFIIGDFESTLKVGNLNTITSTGSFDVFVAKLTSSGSAVWVEKFGDTGSQMASALHVTPDGGIVVGVETCGTIDFGGGPLTGDCSNVFGNGPDVVVAKLDANGGHQWSFADPSIGETQPGSGVGSVTAIESDATGNVYVATSQRKTFVNSSEAESRIRKLLPTGFVIWSYVPTGGSFDALAVNAQGEVWAAGTFEGTVNFPSNGDISAVGAAIVLVHLASNGTSIEVNHFANGVLGNRVAAMVLGPQDAPVVTGRLASAMNFGGGDIGSSGADSVFLAWFDAAINPTNRLAFGGAGLDDSSALLRASDGSLILAGYSDGGIDFGGGPLQTAGGQDAYLAKFDATGTHVWSRIYGTVGAEAMLTAVLMSDDSIAFGGRFDASIDLGGGALTAQSSKDIFLGVVGP